MSTLIKINSVSKTIIFFIITFVLMVIMDPGWEVWINSLQYDLREGESITIRIIVFAFTSLAIAFPYFTKNRNILIIYSAVLIMLTTIGLTFHTLNGQFSILEANIIINEIYFAYGAIEAFLPIIVKCFLYSLMAISVLYFMRPKISLPVIFQRVLFIPLLIPLLYLLSAKGGYWINHFSLPIKVPSAIAFAAMEPVYNGKRNYLSTIPGRNKKNIIYIVDESIRGDLLTINNGDYSTTPYLSKALKTLNFYNYGVTSSMANCSAPANLLLRTGIMLDMLPKYSENLFTSPNIFQYANKSGYLSYYFDAQVSGDRLQNHINKNEIENIHSYVALKNIYSHNENILDQTLANKIINTINNSHGDVFIYANKIGTHFPYQDTYPSENVPTNTSKREHYKNALSWNVDTFFKTLIEGLNKSNEEVIIVYTSDHGQGLGENGNHSTHCMPKLVPDVQARVPMFIVGLNTKLPEVFKPGNGKYSQFQLFSTVLQFMGYSKNNLFPNHQVDLSKPWIGKRFFLSGDLTGRGQLSKNIFNYR